MSLTPTCRVIFRYDPAFGPPQIGGPTHRRPARAVAAQAMVEGAGRRTGWRRNTAREWRQEQHLRHTSGWSREPVARQHLHEPIPEALASQRTWRSVSRLHHLLCRRLRHPQSRLRERGADMDEGGDDEARADAQRSENLGEERSKRKLRLPWLHTRPASLSERWSLVSWRKPIEEKCSAGQDEDWRRPQTRQYGCMAYRARSIESTSDRLVRVFRLWHAVAGISGHRPVRL